MIPWRTIQKQNFTHWKELALFLQLEEKSWPSILKRGAFPLNLPRRLAEKIEKNKGNDPILKQFLPVLEEEIKTKGFLEDPVSDTHFCLEKKLLQKYHGRALILASGACAMHCRFCFRKNFNYETETKGFTQELKAIAQNSSLQEIILSGGDPLSLSNNTLKELVEDLSAIPHLKRLRFHTRFPIGIPERIDDEFLEILDSSSLQIFFVLHCNHSRELDSDIFGAMKRIQKLGIPLLAHSILLKGVNDDFETLKELFETLVNQGIVPYYLNQLDRVQGAAHFEVEEDKGVAWMQQLRHELSGYAVPRYIKEEAHQPSKTLIF